MGFSLVLIFVSVVIASSSSFLLRFENGEPLCPPPAQIEPCTCSKVSERVTALCSNISNQATIRNVFSKNPDWNLQDVHFDQCAFDYIPSSIVKTASFQMLNVTSSSLVSLFDAAPVKTPEISVYLKDVKILRGLQWEFFANSTLIGLGASNVGIKNFGSSFKEHMPQVVKYLWFENTKTASITHQAFQRLVNLEILTLTGGSLKKLSRDMFPRPWNIKLLTFDKQKIAALPKDIFDDIPQLVIFSAENNLFTTLSEDEFSKSGTGYVLIGNPINCNCQVKWITTSGKQALKQFFGTCVEPDTLKGRQLETLTEEDFRYCR